MSYYIAPEGETLIVNDIVIYRVVKRIKDFKAKDGVLYRVFKSKKDMQSSMLIPLYIGENGKLKKKPDFVWRFI